MWIKSIFVAGLVLASSPVAATDWIKYSSSSSGTVFYYDADSIRLEGSKVLLWTKQDYTNDKTEIAKSAILKRLIDCHNLTITMVSIIEYGRDDRILTNITVEPHMQRHEDIVPESTASGLSDQICAK